MPDFTATTGLQALTKAQNMNLQLKSRKATNKKPCCAACQKQVDYKGKDHMNYTIEEFNGHRPYYHFYHLICPRDIAKFSMEETLG